MFILSVVMCLNQTVSGHVHPLCGHVHPLCVHTGVAPLHSRLDPLVSVVARLLLEATAVPQATIVTFTPEGKKPSRILAISPSLLLKRAQMALLLPLLCPVILHCFA